MQMPTYWCTSRTRTEGRLNSSLLHIRAFIETYVPVDAFHIPAPKRTMNRKYRPTRKLTLSMISRYNLASQRVDTAAKNTRSVKKEALFRMIMSMVDRHLVRKSDGTHLVET